MPPIRFRKEQTTVAQRLEIVQKLEKGATVSQLAAEYDLHTRSIHRIRKEAATIRQIAENPRHIRAKRKRALLYEEIDTRLYEWVSERRASGARTTDKLLLQKAMELHKQFGGSLNFTGSRGWLGAFKERHNLMRPRIYRENADANKLPALLSRAPLANPEEHDCKLNDLPKSDPLELNDVSSTETANWISGFREPESIIIKEERLSDGSPCSQTEDEDVNHMFRTMKVWMQTQSEIVKLHAQFLIDHYNLQH